ncbi:transcriptional activator GLI3-like [Triplophysa rosa]|uniref:transcriptional activator GLI3-like n=1 Tax=Triplophysa rosa TaxID=992332 RepID=UPI002545E1E6|nr:transcriptional activator GLI3-like [Triplophysa rosa]
MVGVSCETDNVYRETTYTLSPVPEVWVDKKSASNEFLTPVGTRKTTGVSMKKCLRGKEFRTTGTLDTHLLIHRPEKLHTCDICQRVFKQHQFMSHMSTHHNKKTYHCTYSGCHKTYNDQNSLKDHCALRHGVRITPLSSDSPTSRWEPVDTPAVSKQQSYNTDLHGFFNSPRKLISPNVPKSFSDAEQTHPSQVKPSKRHPSWTLAAASKYYDAKEREMLTSTHWTPSVLHTVEEDPVVISLNDSDFESSPNSLELFPRKMLSLEPSKVTATVGSSNASEAEYSQQHCSIQVKQTLNKLKRKRPSFTLSHAALSCPETKSGLSLIGDFPDPVIQTPSPVPLPESRKRKYNSKDSEKVLTDPAPVPQPSPKRSQTQSPCLVSPSQVALIQKNHTCVSLVSFRRDILTFTFYYAGVAYEGNRTGTELL